MEIKRDLYLKKLIDRQQTKMRIYAEKVNDDGDKARYSSEETH